MDQALKNIFRDEQPITRYTKVVKKINATRYQVTDAYGRLFVVDSDQDWRIGQFVKVQFNRIIGSSKKFTTPKEITV